VIGDERWYWLRVLAVDMIFLFHSSRAFSIIPWHVMSPKPDLGFTLFGIFVSGWIMPMFFVRARLETSNELVLPFYVLHQSIIVAIAFYSVGLNLIAIEKYFLIVLTSFLIIATLLYPIARKNLLRFLFGMS
jgi:hypothetical protein